MERLEKIGKHNTLLLDRAIIESLGLQESDEVTIRVRDGAIVITPHASEATAREFRACLDRVVDERREVLRKLAQ